MGIKTFLVRGAVQYDQVGDLIISVDDNGHASARFEVWREVKPAPEIHQIVNWRGHYEIREGRRYRFPGDTEPMSDWFHTFHNEWGWLRRNDPRVLKMDEWQRRDL